MIRRDPLYGPSKCQLKQKQSESLKIYNFSSMTKLIKKKKKFNDE